jgi:hypothetical protein
MVEKTSPDMRPVALGNDSSSEVTAPELDDTSFENTSEADTSAFALEAPKSPTVKIQTTSKRMLIPAVSLKDHEAYGQIQQDSAIPLKATDKKH